MDFLDAFQPNARTRLLAAAEPLEVARGAWLLRRGEPGGDLYVVESGQLDVVDARRTPELILASLGPGAVVGELAFLDDSPRSADVRAASLARVLRWGSRDLRALLERDPELAAAFYASAARGAAARLRQSQAAPRASTEGALTDAAQHALEEARTLADLVKAELLEADNLLRSAIDDPTALARVRQALDRLEAGLNTLHSAAPDGLDGVYEALTRELAPWLGRAELSQRCVRRQYGHVGSADVLSHVFVGNPIGEGRIGELIDQWLLSRPTMLALRGYRRPLVAAIASHLPRHRNRRALVVGAGTGSLIAQLGEQIQHPPSVITVVDQSREALAFLDQHEALGARSVEIQAVQEDLAQFAIGRWRHSYPQQDAVILHGILEYLPDRLAVSLLRHVGKLLTADGFVIAFALSPSPDAHLLDNLLSWPTIRRSHDQLSRLMIAANLSALDVPASPASEQRLDEPTLLLIGRPAAPRR